MLDLMQIFASLFSHKEVAGKFAARLSRVADEHPQLRRDLIEIGGVLAVQPHVLAQGAAPEVEPPNPYRLAYEAGRRDLALQLLALMGLSPFDLQTMMERDDD